MKCYYHPESDAVAICKNCQRALCMNCAVDVTNGMACKDKCESEVKAINELLARGKTVYQKTSSAYISGAIIYGLIGLFFIGMGILSIIFSDNKGLLFLFPVGIIFLIGAALHIRDSQRIKRIEK